MKAWSVIIMSIFVVLSGCSTINKYEYIKNGNLEQPMNPLLMHFGGPNDFERDRVDFSVTQDGNYIKFNIVKNYRDDYLVQGGIECEEELRQGKKYHVKFKAKASIDKVNMGSIIYENFFAGDDIDGDGNKYTTIYREQFFIGVEERTYEYDFVMKKKSQTPLVWFYLGNNPSNIEVWITDISLREMKK